MSKTGSFSWSVSTGEIRWSEETFRIFQYDRTTKPTLERILKRVHPEDAVNVKKAIEISSTNKSDFEHEEDGQILVSISDTGSGLSAEHAEQMFNAFFTTKPHGTGMGLPISRSIIESHGGRLWASENSPRGATFSFTLPTNVEDRESHTPSPDKALGWRKK